MKKLLILCGFLLVLLVSVGFSTTYYSVQNGEWTYNETWNVTANNYPQQNDTAWINNIVTVNSSKTINATNIWINSTGTFNVSEDVNISFNDSSGCGFDTINGTLDLNGSVNNKINISVYGATPTNDWSAGQANAQVWYARYAILDNYKASEVLGGKLLWDNLNFTNQSGFIYMSAINSGTSFTNSELDGNWYVYFVGLPTTDITFENITMTGDGGNLLLRRVENKTFNNIRITHSNNALTFNQDKINVTFNNLFIGDVLRTGALHKNIDFTCNNCNIINPSGIVVSLAPNYYIRMNFNNSNFTTVTAWENIKEPNSYIVSFNHNTTPGSWYGWFNQTNITEIYDTMVTPEQDFLFLPTDNVTIVEGELIGRGNNMTCDNLTIESAGVYNTSAGNMTVTSQVDVTGDLIGGSGNHSFGALMINAGGVYNATSGTTTITAITGGGNNQVIFSSGGTFTHNLGTFNFTTISATGHYVVSPSDPFYDVNVQLQAAANILFMPYFGIDPMTIAGDLTLVEGDIRAQSRGLTVTGDVAIENGASYNGAALAMTFGSLTIDAGGVYDATTGTTELTNEFAGFTLAVDPAGTFTHNGGTIEVTYAGLTGIRRAGHVALTLGTLIVNNGGNNLFFGANNGGYTWTGDVTLTNGDYQVNNGGLGTPHTINGDVIITSGTFNANPSLTGATMSFGSLSLEGGAYSATTGTTTITSFRASNNRIISLAVGGLTHNDGTFLVTNPTTLKNILTGTTGAGKTFYDFIFNPVGATTYNVPAGGGNFLFAVDNDLTIGVDATVQTGNFPTTITVGNDMTVDGTLNSIGAFDRTITVGGIVLVTGTGTITANGNNNRAFTCGTMIIESGGTYTATLGTTEVTAGDVDIDGTLTHSSGTFYLSSTGTQILSANSSTFYNLDLIGYIISNGSVNIDTNGGLSLNNATLDMNNSFDGEYNISVLSGARVDIENYSLINSTNTNFEYGFDVPIGVSFEMNDSRVEECGWDSTNKGLRIMADYANITYSNFTNNYAGIYFWYGNNSNISNNIIYNNTEGISVGTGSDLNTFLNNTIYNCSIGLNVSDANISNHYFANSTISTSTTYDVALDTNVNVTLLNVTFNRTNTSIVDTSVLSVRWYITVQAVFADYTPFSGVTITANDINSNTEFTDTTAFIGLTSWQTPQEYNETVAGITSTTPHTFDGIVTYFGYVYTGTNTTSITTNDVNSVIVVMSPDTSGDSGPISPSKKYFCGDNKVTSGETCLNCPEDYGYAYGKEYCLAENITDCRFAGCEEGYVCSLVGGAFTCIKGVEGKIMNWFEFLLYKLVSFGLEWWLLILSVASLAGTVAYAITRKINYSVLAFFIALVISILVVYFTLFIITL